MHVFLKQRRTSVRSERGLDEVGVVRASAGARLTPARLARRGLGPRRWDVLTVRLLKNPQPQGTRSTLIVFFLFALAAARPLCLIYVSFSLRHLNSFFSLSLQFAAR